MAAAGNSQLAISGFAPRHFPHSNLFEYISGDPFKDECDFVPAAHKLAPIEPSRPIFVDHKSGKMSSNKATNSL
jgi:hypothetical protein